MSPKWDGKWYRSQALNTAKFCRSTRSGFNRFRPTGLPSPLLPSSCCCCLLSPNGWKFRLVNQQIILSVAIYQYHIPWFPGGGCPLKECDIIITLTESTHRERERDTHPYKQKQSSHPATSEGTNGRSLSKSPPPRQRSAKRWARARSTSLKLVEKKNATTQQMFGVGEDGVKRTQGD